MVTRSAQTVKAVAEPFREPFLRYGLIVSRSNGTSLIRAASAYMNEADDAARARTTF